MGGAQRWHCDGNLHPGISRPPSPHLPDVQPTPPQQPLLPLKTQWGRGDSKLNEGGGQGRAGKGTNSIPFGASVIPETLSLTSRAARDFTAPEGGREEEEEDLGVRRRSERKREREHSYPNNSANEDLKERRRDQSTSH